MQQTYAVGQQQSFPQQTNAGQVYPAGQTPQQAAQAQAVVATPIPGSPAGTAAVLAMACPAPPSEGCPPGFEYFGVLDHLWVMEKPQLIEMVTNWEANQKYQCLNNNGLQVYWAQENTNCCSRQCCGSYRAFTINCFDPIGRPVIKLERPLRCNSAWSCILPINCCFLQTMEMRDINNNLVGVVKQRWSLFKPWFDLCDETGEVLASIEGPCCQFTCCGDIKFELLSAGSDRKVIGEVTKKWGGVVKEVFLPSNADNFACVFPMELSWKAKALVFASTFLIDFMFFEDRGRDKKRKMGVQGNAV